MNIDFQPVADTAKYETPVGGFDTWEEAMEACERADLDHECIRFNPNA